MRTRRRLEPRRVAWFALVALMLAAIGWLALRAAVVRALPALASPVIALAPHDGRTTLERLTFQITTAHAPPAASVYNPVVAAAAAVPLDDRPFLLLAIRALADGREADGVRLLEEGRRRNPRQRFTRLLLLDRYLRARRTADAVGEMTVLNRLLPPAGAVLATALAKLAVDPATAGPARTALAGDGEVLNRVLAAMAASNADPATIVRFAGRGAPAGLGQGGWRTALIDAMIARGQFSRARAAWQSAYQIPAAAAASPLYDMALRGTVGGPPFNWNLTANEIGAAEIGGGALQVEYYARRSGPLAQQLMTLGPGRYRLRYAISGTGGEDNSGLAWSVACQTTPTVMLVTGPATPLRATATAVAFDFAIPTSGCAAQLLTLSGIEGEFAGAVSARISQLSLSRLP